MEAALESLLEDPRVVRAVALAREDDERTLADQVRISSVAAPSFAETERGRLVAELLAEEGLASPAPDGVGNVLALRPGMDGGAPLVVSAHLDTVFPEGTDVTVTREGTLLRGPGISDDGRGLAVLVSLARLLRLAGIGTARPLLFAATVGEEGLGDLRGVRHLFGAGPGRGAAGFVSVDGAGIQRIVTRGPGSRRFRVTARGPGGHSWLDWGTPNPIHALGSAVGRLATLLDGSEPGVTLTVARWGGGTSINAIPQDAWFEVDARGEREDRLERLESALREAVRTSVRDHGGEPPRLEVEITAVGRRPAGETAFEQPLVQAALAATRRLGVEPETASSSTDANVPMSLGVPAITIGGGGDAGGVHTTGEWYRNTNGPQGVLRALYTVLLFAGLR